MLITKEVEIKINVSNIHHYINRSYNVKVGDNIIIPVKDVYENAKVKIECLCDYCLEKGKTKKLSKKYYKYLNERKFINKDTCYECRYEKEYDLLVYKNNNGLLKHDDRRYYAIKENRLNDLKQHIIKYGTITNLKTVNGKLNNGIITHGETPFVLAEELGYDLLTICSKLPNNYLEDWEKFKILIEKLINKFNRFPTQEEIAKEYNIGTRHITKHGGMYEIKRKLNYIDDGDLIDDSGYYNLSSYEYILSQWLIYNTNVKIDRNVIISPIPEKEGNYNCDFVLTQPNNKKIWIEIWGGYKKHTDTSKFKDYNEKYNIKMNLYNKYNINLISLYLDFFEHKKYEELQNDIYNLFKDIVICEKNTNFTITKIIPYYLLDESELLEKILSYSDNKDIFPKIKYLSDQDNRLYREISKRYGSVSAFAEKMGKKVRYKGRSYWNIDKIIDRLDKLHIKYNKLLTMTEIKNNKGSCDICKDLYSLNLNNYGGFKFLQLKYLDGNISKINSDDILLLNKVIKKGKEEIKQLAKQILDKYNVMQNLSPAN